jgi:hypothetical protein
VQLLQQVIGKLAITIEVETDYLHVDRRGQAEIQDLPDHIGGQKCKLDGRIIERQFHPQGADEVGRRPMFLSEIDENIRIAGTHRRRRAVREVDGAIRQP